MALPPSPAASLKDTTTFRAARTGTAMAWVSLHKGVAEAIGGEMEKGFYTSAVTCVHFSDAADVLFTGACRRGLASPACLLSSARRLHAAAPAMRVCLS